MKINLTERIMKDRNDFLMHIILDTLTSSIIKELKGNPKEGGTVADVRLTIDGHELNLESFCKHWQSQVHRMIKEEAVEIVQDKCSFSDIYDLLYDLEERIKPEINKRLEDWEK